MDAEHRCPVDFCSLEISQGLFDVEQRRLSKLASCLFLGNTLLWRSPFEFDYVCTMILLGIPGDLRKPFLDNLYGKCVKPDRCLILGPWNRREMEDELSKTGFIPRGYCEKTVPGRSHETKRIIWIDKEGPLQGRMEAHAKIVKLPSPGG